MTPCGIHEYDRPTKRCRICERFAKMLRAEPAITPTLTEAQKAARRKQSTKTREANFEAMRIVVPGYVKRGPLPKAKP
jgi:hypothetical protein